MVEPHWTLLNTSIMAMGITPGGGWHLNSDSWGKTRRKCSRVGKRTSLECLRMALARRWDKRLYAEKLQHQFSINDCIFLERAHTDTHTNYRIKAPHSVNNLRLAGLEHSLDSICRWITGFLTDSRWRWGSTSAPHSCILCPLLFCLYTYSYVPIPWWGDSLPTGGK